MHHAFGYVLPGSVADGLVHSIHVKVHANNWELNESPRTIQYNVPVFPTAVPNFYQTASNYEVGERFNSSQAGCIKALRFFQASSETGSHTVNLWSDTGTKLASVTIPFTSGEGWKEGTLSTPYVITANTNYRVSYNVNTQDKKYNCTPAFPFSNSPLTATAGFYSTPAGTFPNTSDCSNLFADVKLYVGSLAVPLSIIGNPSSLDPFVVGADGSIFPAGGVPGAVPPSDPKDDHILNQQAASSGTIPDVTESGVRTGEGADPMAAAATEKPLSVPSVLEQSTPHPEATILPNATWNMTYRDDSNRLSTEYAVNSSGTTRTKDYFYLGNLLVATNDTSCGTRYYASDHLGTPRIEMDVNGGSPTLHTYQPYGQEITTVTSCPTQPEKLKFAAMERDSSTGNDYDHARFHLTGMGRFLGVDPLGGSPSVPLTWNRYSYALSNPLIFLDPTGLDSCPDGDPSCASPADASQSSTKGPTTDKPAPGAPRFSEYQPVNANFQMGWLEGWGGSVADGPMKGPMKNAEASQPCKSHGFGSGYFVGGNVDVGSVVSGASATGGAGAGAFFDPNSPSVMSFGAFAEGGASAYAGSAYTGAPTQNGHPFAAGSYVGGSGGAFFTNAASVQQLRGPFTTVSLNLEVAAFQFAYDSNGTGILSIGIGPGFGFSLSKLTTTTTVTGAGCR